MARISVLLVRIRQRAARGISPTVREGSNAGASEPCLTVGLLPRNGLRKRGLMLSADQIDHRFVSGNRRGVHGIRSKEIPITGAQSVDLMPNPQFQRAADDPMRLIFSVGVRSIPGPRRIGPLKDTVAFVFQTLPQLSR